MAFTQQNRAQRQSLKLADQQWNKNSMNNVSAYNNIPPNYGADSLHKTAVSILEPRLPELLVLELHRDGGFRQHRHYTVRGLYRYVLEAIANRAMPAAATHPWRRATTFPSSSVSAGEVVLPPLDTETVEERNAEHVTYRERLGGYLHPRDMRRLVTPFSTSNEPELMVRRHVMLLNYDPLRAIILRDRLLVLVPDGADSLLSTLEQRVRGGREAMEDSIFGSAFHVDQDDDPKTTTTTTTDNTLPTVTKMNTLPTQSSTSIVSDPNDDDHRTIEANGDNANDEWHEMTATNWANLPFELQCADAVLHMVSSILSEETFEVQTAAEALIEHILHGGHGLEDDPLTVIRALKDAVQLMSSRVKSFAQSLHRLLDDEEDMALMNLSRLLTHPERFVQPVSQRILSEESDEPELILEANLQIALTLTNYLDLIQGKIQSATELMDQRLDAMRNKLLFAEMMISVAILCLTLSTLVGAFFGMNVEIPPSIHTYPKAFELVVLYSCLGCLMLFVFIMIVLMYTGTIPVRFRHRFRRRFLIPMQTG